MKLLAWILLMTATPALAQEVCSAATVSVTITDLEVGEGSISAKGAWQVGGGATGVLLSLRIGNGSGLLESHFGSSGSWSFTGMEFGNRKCGLHALGVSATPSFQVGERLVHCPEQGSSALRQFEISCTPKAEILDCQWECTGGETPQCSGVCAASARLGRPNYLPFWGVNGEGWQQAEERSSAGPWSHPVTCAPGQRISFKVRDRNGLGIWSEVDEIGCGVTE